MKRDLAAGCSAKSLMLRPWNLRERSSNEKKKDPGGLSAVAGVLVVLPMSTA